MDDFNRMSCKECGPGGLKCPCCGPAPGKDRKRLRKRIRSRMKQQLREEIKKTQIYK